MPKFEYRNNHKPNQNKNSEQLVTDSMVKDDYCFFVDLLPDHILKTNSLSLSKEYYSKEIPRKSIY